MLIPKCPKCGNILNFLDTESTERTDSYWYEYELHLCSKCRKNYSSVHTFQLVEQSNEIVDEVKRSDTNIKPMKNDAVNAVIDEVIDEIVDDIVCDIVGE